MLLGEFYLLCEDMFIIFISGNCTDTQARHLVEQMGYPQVYNVRNGITWWISDGHDVKRIQF